MTDDGSGRTACIVDKTCEGDIYKLHLSAGDGVVDAAVPVEVPSHIWDRFDIGASVEVPDGDLRHPQVAARIRWVF